MPEVGSQIRVTVSLYAHLLKYAPRRGEKRFVVHLPEGSTVADLLERLAIPSKEAKLLVLNARQVEPATVIRDGDELSLFPPIAGGEEKLEEELRASAPNGTLPCAKALALAQKHSVPPKLVGKLCNKLKIRITSCQLGCFK